MIFFRSSHAITEQSSFFLSRSLFSASAYSQGTCADVINSAAAEARLKSRRLVEQENILRASPSLYQDMINIVSWHTSVGDRKAALISRLRRDPFLEGRIPFPALEGLIVNKIDYSKTPNAEELSAMLTLRLAERENRYDRLRDQSAVTLKIDLSDSTKVRKSGKLLERFELIEPISFRDMMSLQAYMNQIWPKSWNGPERDNSPKVLVVELKELPGTTVLIFNNSTHMNSAFFRASYYIETKPEILLGDGLFGMRAGGHDLTSDALLKYWQAASTIGFKSKDPQEQLRLGLEKELFEEYLLKFIKSRGKAVVLAVDSNGFAETVLSHETFHAQFFLEPKFFTVVQEFWSTRVDAKDQDIFKEQIKDLYDVNDMYLLMNEFQAYTLQQNQAAATINFADPKAIMTVLTKYRRSLREFLKERGIVTLE